VEECLFLTFLKTLYYNSPAGAGGMGLLSIELLAVYTISHLGFQTYFHYVRNVENLKPCFIFLYFKYLNLVSNVMYKKY